MSYYTPFRGVAGRRVREDDEHHHLDMAAPREMVARYTGRCVTTNARINPGDIITHIRGVGSTLVRRGTI